ncbi:hypothetical protein EZZ79_24775 [Pseudomonas syringae]|nr:hypothetical protein EZZ79_24775 [Pseudomonas syringae]
MKSPTGLYCANSQKRTKSLLLPSSLTIQANLFAKGPVQSQKIRRLKQSLREQVRSYKSHPAPMPKRRSELVRERARTGAEDLPLETMSSRTSSLLQRPSGSNAQT